MIQSAEITANDVAHHYDELDDFYRELWGTHLHHGLWISGKESKEEAVENLSRKVLSYLGNLKDMQLVDVGCGYGGTTRLATTMGASFVSGITLSPKQFLYAQKASEEYPVEFILGDWTQNQIPDHVFDGGFSIECFSHIKNKKRFFEEVKRTLKPGRRFAMTAWLAGENLSAMDKSLILEPICSEGRLPSLFTKNEVMELISSSDLQFIEHVDLSDKVWKTWLISVKEVMGLFKSPEGIRYFMNSQKKERKFALSVLRILAGYRKGCFRYGLFVMKT